VKQEEQQQEEEEEEVADAAAAAAAAAGGAAEEQPAAEVKQEEVSSMTMGSIWSWCIRNLCLHPCQCLFVLQIKEVRQAMRETLLQSKAYCVRHTTVP
jgi:biotin carboxyl carrier protein